MYKTNTAFIKLSSSSKDSVPSSTRSSSLSAIQFFAIPSACVEMNLVIDGHEIEGNVTMLRFTYSIEPILYRKNASLIWAQNLCEDAPGNHGGICLKNGTTAIRVRPGINISAKDVTVNCPASTKESFFFPAMTSYPNVVASETEVDNLCIAIRHE